MFSVQRLRPSDFLPQHKPILSQDWLHTTFTRHSDNLLCQQISNLFYTLAIYSVSHLGYSHTQLVLQPITWHQRDRLPQLTFPTYSKLSYKLKWQDSNVRRTRLLRKRQDATFCYQILQHSLHFNCGLSFYPLLIYSLPSTSKHTQQVSLLLLLF